MHFRKQNIHKMGCDSKTTLVVCVWGASADKSLKFEGIIVFSRGCGSNLNGALSISLICIILKKYKKLSRIL